MQPLESVIDRTGFCWAELTWDNGELAMLRVPGAIVHRAAGDHPVLGQVSAITNERGEPLTVMSAIDWAHPTEIPAIAEPSRLPRGAGGVVINVLALLARPDHGLRYAGPWPTSALYQALLRSFRTTASEAEFTAGALERGLRGARDVLPFDLFAAPHERVAHARGHVEIRDGIERAVIDGVAYDSGVARIVEDRAEVWFGDARWAHVATFAPDGSLRESHALPACTTDAIGKAFPAPLREAIAELVAEAVPVPLAAAARIRVERGPIVWADLGAHAATPSGDGFAVHGALWERLAPQGLARVALAIAEALVPVVTIAAARDVGVMSQLAPNDAMVKP